MKLTKLLSFTIIVFSCSQPENYTNIIPDNTILIEKVDEQSLIKLSDWIKEVNIVPLEFGKDFILGNIEKIKIYEDKIFILDGINKSTIFCFDISGKYLNEISSLGEGPQNIRLITDFDLDVKRKEVMIYDNLTRKIKTYDFKGTFLKTIEIPYAADHLKFKNDTIVLYRNNPQVDLKTELNIFDRNGKFLNGYFKSETKEINLGSNNALTASSFVNDILFIMRLNTNIYKLSNNGLSIPWEIDFGKHRLTSEFRRKIEEDPTNSSTLINDNDLVSDITNFHDLGKNLVFSYSYQGITYSVFYNKENKNYDVSYNIIDDISGLFFQYPVYQHEGEMVGTFDPHGIKNNINWIEKNIENFENHSIMANTLELLKKTYRDDMGVNPIIVFYKLK